MIQIRDIKKSFGSLEVLKGINLTIEKGEVVSIVGPSGAGKTTLLQIIGSLDRADSGSVTFGGQDITRLSQRKLADFRNRHIGFVFQFHQLLPEFSALENVMIPALIAGTPRRQAKERAEALELRNRMKDMTVVVTAKGGGAGRLFGSVTNTEVSEALAKQAGIQLDKRKIVLDEPIKSVGVYTVKCKLGYEVNAELKIEVKEA